MIHHAKDAQALFTGNGTVTGEVVRCKVFVPPEASTRTVWFTVQPCYIDLAADIWSSAGELRFYFAGALVGPGRGLRKNPVLPARKSRTAERSVAVEYADRAAAAWIVSPS